MANSARDTAAPAAPPRRQRPPPRPVTVRSIARLTPRVIGVTFAGDELAEFTPPRPGAHMKLVFAPPGEKVAARDAMPPGAPRPPSRTYTPLRFDAAARTLDCEFVLHGDGIAAEWVTKAKPGDPLHIAGPGGGWDLPEDLRHLVIVADDTAMPAAGTILEALPAGAGATVFCEIEDAAEERPLSPTAAASPTWLHRMAGGQRTQPGLLLEQAVRDLDVPAGTYWWIACEAAAMRRIRSHLLKERGVAPDHVHTRGYWKLGETNYPDHDYGND